MPGLAEFNRDTVRSETRYVRLVCGGCCAWYQAGSDYLLKDFKTFGFLFESLVVRDMKVYSSAIGGRLSLLPRQIWTRSRCRPPPKRWTLRPDRNQARFIRDRRGRDASAENPAADPQAQPDGKAMPVGGNDPPHGHRGRRNGLHMPERRPRSPRVRADAMRRRRRT